MRTKYKPASKDETLQLLDSLIARATSVFSTRLLVEWEGIQEEKKRQMDMRANILTSAKYRCYSWWNRTSIAPLMKQVPRITIVIAGTEFKIINLKQPLESFQKRIKKAPKGLFQ